MADGRGGLQNQGVTSDKGRSISKGETIKGKDIREKFMGSTMRKDLYGGEEGLHRSCGGRGKNSKKRGTSYVAFRMMRAARGKGETKKE